MGRHTRTFHILVVFAVVCLLDLATLISAIISLWKGWLVLATIYAAAAYLLFLWIYDFLRVDDR